MIFSLFGKKEKPLPPSSEKNSSRKRNDKESGRDTDGGRSPAAHRNAAHATAMKIDAIESEMSSEFGKTRAPTQTRQDMPGTSSQPKPAAKKVASKPLPKNPGDPLTFTQTTTTSSTLTGNTLHGNTLATLAESESAPVLEEAAILFANNQADMAELALQGAIRDGTLGNAAITAWKMLFDLYQVTGQREEFDRLSLEYASKFETSPPSWIESAVETQAAPEPAARSTPVVPFSGKLDGTIIKQLERAQTLAGKSHVLRLEFVRVTEVDPVGCGILLSVLKKLQKSGNDLILVGALELVEKIRAILEVGRRAETEAPWLLMLELLRLLNMEQEFEEASIDYCVTFEVSPPPFVAPKNKVTTALDEKSDEPSEAEQFAMPATIEGRTDQLISAITVYANEHPAAILDCSQLSRVDFNAAGQLLTGLAPLMAKGANIEFHHVNHLVFTLMQTMGMHEMFRITLRKH